jgi:hypothetical protein
LSTTVWSLSGVEPNHDLDPQKRKTKKTVAELLCQRVENHVGMFRSTNRTNLYAGAGAAQDVTNVFADLVQQAKTDGALRAYAVLLTSDPTKISEEFIAESTYAATRAVGDEKVQILFDGVSVVLGWRRVTESSTLW